MGNLPGFVDLSSDDQRVAVRQAPGNRADQVGLPPGRSHSLDRDALGGIIHLKPGREPFQVARCAAAVCVEQTGILNASRILLQMLVDRVQPAFVGQAGDEVQLIGNHSVGSRDQVVIGLPIDEAEQQNDEDREHAGYRQRPLKSIRTYDLGLTHRISPRRFPAQRVRRRVATSHVSLMVRCEE